MRPDSPLPGEEVIPHGSSASVGEGQGLDLLGFVRRTYPNYVAAPHHRLLIEKLEAVERGEIRRLMLFVPPRHGKSELASVRFPAWCIGRNPGRKLILASYGAVLAYKFSRRVRNLVRSPLFGRLYPGIELTGDAEAVAFWAWQHDGEEAGAFNAAGVGGGITGEGCDLLIIDDPVKDAKEALSLTVRDDTFEWYASTAYTRLDQAANAVVVIQTRWHEDDLSGRLLQAAEEGGEKWEVVDLPALAEAGREDALGRAVGQPLWPARFDTTRLAVIRTTVTEPWWQALYQQRPPETLGGRYFRTFRPTVDGQPHHVWPVDLVRRRYKLGADQAFPPLPHEAPGWVVWCAVDGGVRDPWCCLWFVRAPDGRVFLWDEQYQTGITPLRQAQRTKQRIASVGGRWLTWPEKPEGPPRSAVFHVDTVRLDPSMFVPRANVGVADADIYAGAGLPVQKAFNPRVPGWRRILERLEARDDGLPGLVVLAGAAPNLLRTLPRLTADPDDPEDIEDGQEDHAADALRYGVNPAAAALTSRKGVDLLAEMPETEPPLAVVGPFGSPNPLESRWQ